ncbi:MAG: phospho-sugar mutase [Clostridia bacterium]|nr:phospho-sugar mutase [Clostridia bacterium]
MIKSYREEYEKWLNSPVLTQEERAEIAAIGEDEDTKKLRFGLEMSFGTAGLRSTMDMGPGCMNVYTVAQTTQALAELILGQGGAARGVAIACDSRNNAQRFAETAASVLAANGIKVYLFDSLRPTPELSFAVIELGCIAGINITASHNPKEYNGYKAYWEDGAQLNPDQAATVAAAREKIDVLTGAKKMPLDDAISAGLVEILDERFDERYLQAVLATVIRPEVIQGAADTLKIVYTPLHGAGHRLVPEVLRRAGFRHIYTVDEQMKIDGNFPTVKKPNPEYRDVFALGIQIANEVGSDLVVATDPDSDRVGVVVRNAEGEFDTVTGNQMGALLLDYIIRARRAAGTLTADDYAVKSIVSTPLADKIAKVQGVTLYNVLTGFKFIGEVISGYEARGQAGDYLLGFEESYGYLTGTYARDKDAVGATLLICEMTAYYAEMGKTLSDALADLYNTYGVYREHMIDIYMEGLDGIARRRTVMEQLRKAPPAQLGGASVAEVSDFLAGVARELATGKETPLTLPKTDMLIFALEGGDKVIIRPSGTEPKIKIYFHASAATSTEVTAKIDRYVADARRMAEV